MKIDRGMRRWALWILCALLVTEAQSSESPSAGRITAPSGKTYEIISTTFMARRPGSRPTAIVVQFRVDSLDDIPKLKEAAEEIYPFYVGDAERLGLHTIGVQATKFVGPREHNFFLRYGFVWNRKSDGSWHLYDPPKPKDKMTPNTCWRVPWWKTAGPSSPRMVCSATRNGKRCPPARLDR